MYEKNKKVIIWADAVLTRRKGLFVTINNYIRIFVVSLYVLGSRRTDLVCFLK